MYLMNDMTIPGRLSTLTPFPAMTRSSLVSPDDIRTRFRAPCPMYRQEVPQYGTLLDLVADINADVLAGSPELRDSLARSASLERLNLERHGAIRLGTAAELATMRRVFAVMGMEPVGYYDLSVAGIGPFHRLPPRGRRGAGGQSLPRVHLAAATGTARRPGAGRPGARDPATAQHLHGARAG